ncbi:endonuclease/exonuclease/phosphatase family protein [Micromonospora narathiwatensis]|uniref:Metal-dependent hydrolase, endonuclease/exonuclease/phosphatase family n=1 Tax=Micromonospora narathiwatensis TaxID=299146 RepID=A0A1A8ZFR3_9ACTN|nr:endonuclease/exonuclease/phosphatase family protein [Micromonospora narathiwatensis]SBT42649.1 Metal-dependent hydrolase, endonuclease/exonuclease/phosphatase family [Micromonospora narathiwatensis]
MTADPSTMAVDEPGPAAGEAGGARPRRRRWVTWFVLGASGAWLVFVAAHRGLSGRVWWWNLPDLAPPLLFLAVPVLLLAVLPLARPARKVGTALVVGALVLGWPCAGVNAAALWHRPPPAPPDAITIFSWNTWYWDQLVRTGPGGEPIRDPDRFYRYLRAQAADVYLLQEQLYIDGHDWSPLPVTDPDRVRREFPGFHVAVSGELVTVSRFPIVLDRPVDLRPWLARQWPDLPPADSRLPAYHTVKTLRTDLLVAGRVVSFYNAHLYVPVVGLPARGGGTGEDALARQDLREANYRAVAADVADNPHPIVLAGDLNTSPAMRLVRTLPDRLVDASGALDSLYPTSWARYGLPLWRLDWVFTSADVDVHRYRMVPQGGLSDHNGQLVVVSIRPCRERTLCR